MRCWLGPCATTRGWSGGRARPPPRGDPTEGALIVAAAREGLDRNKLDEQWPRQGSSP